MVLNTLNFGSRSGAVRLDFSGYFSCKLLQIFQSKILCYSFELEVKHKNATQLEKKM